MLSNPNSAVAWWAYAALGLLLLVVVVCPGLSRRSRNVVSAIFSLLWMLACTAGWFLVSLERSFNPRTHPDPWPVTIAFLLIGLTIVWGVNLIMNLVDPGPRDKA